jgi:chemotaxis protein MotB
MRSREFAEPLDSQVLAAGHTAGPSGMQAAGRADMSKHFIRLAPIVAVVSGCVSTGRYDSAVADATKAKAELLSVRTTATKRAQADHAEVEALHNALIEADHRSEALLQQFQELRAQSQTCAKGIDEATAMNAALRKELARLGKDVDQLLATKGALASSLEQARGRLEELRKAQAAAESRAALFREVALRFKRMLDAGELEIALRSGRMVLILPNDVLFDSGKAELKPQGTQTLVAVGEVLSSLKDRRFQVAGHTDDEPIRFSGFSSNWELSSSRALAVVRVLIKAGMRPETLSAAGYAEFDPVQANDSTKNKAKNRRTEITLQPNIDELVAVPKAG